MAEKLFTWKLSSVVVGCSHCFVGFLCLVLVLLCSTYSVVSSSSRRGRESGLFYFNCPLMACDCQCSVSLPCGAVGWSEVGDC